MSVALSHQGLDWELVKEEILLLCVRWHLIDHLSYRQLNQKLEQRGLSLDPSTFSYLIKHYSAKISRNFSQTINNKFWHLKQKYIVSSTQNQYLYLAVSEEGSLLDFFLTNQPQRYKALNFFKKTLDSSSYKRKKIQKSFKKLEKFRSYYKVNQFLLSSIISGLGLIGLLLLAKMILSQDVREQDIKIKSVIKNQTVSLKKVNKEPPNATALDSLFPYEKAFLDTIAWAEGTLHSDGYKLQFGGKVINDLSQHPNQCIEFKTQNQRDCSTAFGRYQILNYNAEGMSFTPENQDQWAIEKLEEIGSLAALRQGDIEGAIKKACHTWVTLPCHEHPSGSHRNKERKSMDKLLAKYQERYQLYQY